MISITHTHNVDNNHTHTQRVHNTFLALPNTTSPPHTFLSKKRITQPASSVLSPTSATTPVHSTTKPKLIPKSSIAMYKHIILKTKEYYDKAITEERNQGVVSSPIRITKNDDNVVSSSSSSSSYMLLSSNCNVKRNLMDYFNGGNSQCNGMNSKSRCLHCNGGNGEFKQKSLRDFFKR